MKQHASKKSVPPSVGADVAGIESCSTAILIQFDRHLQKTAPIRQLCLPQTGVSREEALHRQHAERGGAR